MKILKLIIWGSIILSSMFCGSPYENPNDDSYVSSSIEGVTLDVVRENAKDSLDLKLLIGDTFMLSLSPSFMTRNNMMLVEIRVADPIIIDPYRIHPPDPKIYENYVAVIDIKQKKMCGIAHFKEGYKRPIFDYYRDTLYLTDQDNFYAVQFYDVKTKQYHKTIIDPCNLSPGAGSIVRTGDCLFITGKPYQAGIVNWNTKFCIETCNYPIRSSNCGFTHPINKDINLINYSEDTLQRRHLYAYNSKGKKIWTYTTSENQAFTGYKDYFIGVGFEYLVVLRKKDGTVQQAIKIGNGWRLFDMYENTVRVSRRIPNKSIKRSEKVSEFTDIMSFDLKTGKCLWVKRVVGRIVQEFADIYFPNVALDSLNPKQYPAYNDVIGYRKSDFEQIFQRKFYQIPVKTKDRFYAGENMITDRETDKLYARINKMVYW